MAGIELRGGALLFNRSVILPKWNDRLLIRSSRWLGWRQGDLHADSDGLPFWAHVAAARIYHALGSATEPVSEFERALAIHPEA